MRDSSRKSPLNSVIFIKSGSGIGHENVRRGGDFLERWYYRRGNPVNSVISINAAKPTGHQKSHSKIRLNEKMIKI